jgi:hypothetical protein
VLLGEVSGGKEWNAALGEGWVFRVIPIQPAAAGYSGWDLVVDREQAAGFPDALLLATPPFDSINEREIGTTFGVRAQDAIGWNPRSFRFLTDVAVFRKAQGLFRAVKRDNAGAGQSQRSTANEQGVGELMRLARLSAAGQFRILDARVTPGVADAAPFAESWAIQAARTPHSLEPAPVNRSTPLGTLNWMRFSVTVWLPRGWKVPPSEGAVPGSCAG